MTSRVAPAAASALLADLLADPATRLVEAARTPVSVHLATGRDDVPVLCVCTPAAVRLPASVVSPVLPSGRVHVVDGGLHDGATAWRVTRWWRPARPLGLRPPSRLPDVGVAVPAEVQPLDLVGRGPGLTPSGDDVLAGALVAASATSDPGLPALQEATCAALAARRTTAVSWGLLHHALAGWATDELAAFVTAVCAGHPASAVTDRLLRVGHSSGASLAAGALHVLGGGLAHRDSGGLAA